MAPRYDTSANGSLGSVKMGFGAIGRIGTFPLTAAGSNGRRNTCGKFTRRSLQAQSFSGALIEAQRDLVQLALRVAGNCLKPKT